ncbi:hypothetical protein [Caballeronia sp. Lep1P3]|uniref:hypothetical protein n=1 Tax=Caballeronia sp. Lep1P3 TaxID=2878150 RepID=UPI001FD1F27C|nr:hypothetical protein [Caballeronia sp. Lep1P3]
MKSRFKSAAFALLAVSAGVAIAGLLPLRAHAAENGAAIWAANPVGAQPMPDAQALSLLPSGGYAPLRTSGGKCLLVARRGTRIVAVELSPLAIGAKVIGWKPQTIDMNALTSKWGYRPQQSTLDAKAFGNPVTNSIAQTATRADAWSRALASGETESAATVTANGKTYRTYSRFKPATPEAPLAASDEYFCQ